MQQNEEDLLFTIVCLAFSYNIVSQCTKVDLEEGVRKTTILRHNYIAITTKDDIPGEVEVHYSILGNNGQNEVKTERPFHTNIAANRKYIHV